MRTLIIITIVVLAISTIGAGKPAPPQPIQFGIKDVTFGQKTTAVPEGASGDFIIVDGYRDYRAPDSVIDSTDFDKVDFPQYSRFH